jgi:hypothetical protein
MHTVGYDGSQFAGGGSGVDVGDGSVGMGMAVAVGSGGGTGVDVGSGGIGVGVVMGWGVGSGARGASCPEVLWRRSAVMTNSVSRLGSPLCAIPVARRRSCPALT